MKVGLKRCHPQEWVEQYKGLALGDFKHLEYLGIVFFQLVNANDL